jgi:uncharacterized membrane protein
MGKWIAKYSLALAVPVVSVLALASVGPHVTPLMCLFAAIAGVVVMALIDTVVSGRYFITNRAEAKRRRRIEAEQHD